MKENKPRMAQVYSLGLQGSVVQCHSSRIYTRKRSRNKKRKETETETANTYT